MVTALNGVGQSIAFELTCSAIISYSGLNSYVFHLKCADKSYRVMVLTRQTSFVNNSTFGAIVVLIAMAARNVPTISLHY